jgi:hypothetical protein
LCSSLLDQAEARIGVLVADSEGNAQIKPLENLPGAGA